MNTKKLYKENTYLRETEARIIEIREIGERIAVITDQTVFFPVGGGQSSDICHLYVDTEDGRSHEFEIVEAYEYDKEVLHVLGELKQDGEADSKLRYGKELSEIKVGGLCRLRIDWAHRFDNMQRHCGEHILTGIFYREYGGVNRGFHMGDDYMTIDIALEEEANVKKLGWEECKKAELISNEVIYENMPISVRHFDSFDEAAAQPMRKKLTIEDDITLVGIGKPEYDWGCVACCGTHPDTTGQVGLIKVYKIESNKGMFRIYFEAGRRAFLKYQTEYDTLQELGRSLSAGTNDIVSKYEAQAEKNKEKSYQLGMLKREIIARESRRIKDILKGELQMDKGAPYGGDIDENGFYINRYEMLSVDDLSQLGREIGAAVPSGKLTFLIHEPSNTMLLVSSGKPDCGKLVKENAPIYGGKGGGNSTLARAIFTKAEYIETFIDLIEKHLR